MAHVAGVTDYRELDVWKLADDARRRVLGLTDRPAFERDWWLKSQIRRASHSACANVAEGFARYYPREFARFLHISRGSLAETCEHLLAANQAGLVTTTEMAEIDAILRRAQRAATSLIRYLDRTAAVSKSRDR